jgi:hypothetical protein
MTDTTRIDRDAATHPWRIVRNIRADWGHHIYTAITCAACGTQLPYTGHSGLQLCPTCTRRSAVTDTEPAPFDWSTDPDTAETSEPTHCHRASHRNR